MLFSTTIYPRSHEVLTGLAGQMGTDVPSRRELLKCIADIPIDNTHDYEFRIMESVRDVFIKSSRRRKSVAESVVSETTDVGSFSRQTPTF